MHMKTIFGSVLALVVVAAAGTLSACDQKAPAKGGAGPKQAGGGEVKYKIAVIPKGTTHDFWKGVERGARKAIDEPHWPALVSVVSRLVPAILLK